MWKITSDSFIVNYIIWWIRIKSLILCAFFFTIKGFEAFFMHQHTYMGTWKSLTDFVTLEPEDMNSLLFSSPKPKAQVCFLSVVVINFSHFHLFLQNHWTNFNQTWHKASLDEGDLSLIKWRALPFSKGR